MTPADCIRAAIPSASDDLCDHIMWGRTPYPFTNLGAREFYKAASRYQRASKNGVLLCELCDKPAVNGWTCASCKLALDSVAESAS